MGAANNAIAALLIAAVALGLNGCRKDRRGVSGGVEIIDLRVGTGIKNVQVDTVRFKTTDTIVVRYDVKNLVAMREGKAPVVWVRQDVTVRDMNGAIVCLKPSVVDARKRTLDLPPYFLTEISLAGVKGLKPGDYTVSLLVTDLVGFTTVQKDIPIELL